MPEPSLIFILAMTTFILGIGLAAAQLYRVRHAKPRKLKERMEQGTGSSAHRPQHSR